MTSKLHSAFCCEILAAHFQGREPLSYGDFQRSWEAYSRESKRSRNDQAEVSDTDCTRSTTTNLGSEGTEAGCPVFVSWKARTKKHDLALRGCKGTFRALPLAQGLAEFALISAREDHRFTPIEDDVLPSLTCEVTLLHSFETCTGPLDWEIGVHGIRIAFEDNGVKYGATYLPDVAVQQGWDKKQAILSAIRKSGSKVLQRASLKASHMWSIVEALQIKVIRYQGVKSHIQYSEWERWRLWLSNEANSQDANGQK